MDFETNELNYLFGGYFSGVGSIRLYRNRRKKATYTLCCTVCFNNQKMAKLFEKSFGGSLRKMEWPKHWPTSVRHKKKLRQWRWDVVGCELADFITAIYPFVICNRMKKRIKVAKAYHSYQQKNAWTTTERVRKQKHKYYLQMKRLR